MPPPRSTAQRQPAPRDSGTSYSRPQQAQNPPDLSGRLVYADPRSLPSFPSLGVQLNCTNSAALTASTSAKSPPPIVDVNGPTNPVSLKAATAAAAASAALYSAASPALPVPPSQSSVPSEIAGGESPDPSSPSAPRSSGASLTAASHAHHQRHHHRKPTGDPATTTDMSSQPPQPSTASWGNSAATQAFRNSQIASANYAAALPEKPAPEVVQLGLRPSLRAAKGAMKTSPGPAAADGSSTPTLRQRNRSTSTPVAYRHQKSFSDTTGASNSAAAAASNSANALSAATIALSGASKAHSQAGNRYSYTSEGGAVPYTNMNRQMYTSHPPVAPEVDEQNHADVLHASAVAMAKRMYNPKAETGGAGAGAGTAHTTLQEAAYKLAQERLDRLHEIHQKDREYRDHYVDPKLALSSAGTNDAGDASADAPSRFNIRSRLRRRRSSSDSEIAEDRRRSLEIRNQMSLLSNRISEVDQDKRRRDRQAVLLAAQRNVKAQLHDIDEQVYAESGRLPPARLVSWESKAHAAAQARVDARLSMYPRSDQIDIGGGKFMDRDEVNKIAARRVQPIIDDLNERAQAEHERQAAIRQNEEDRKVEAEMLKARDKEMKEMYRNLKQEEKQKNKTIKEAQKARKAEDKAAKKQPKEFKDKEVAHDDDSDTMTTAGAAAAAAVVAGEANTSSGVAGPSGTTAPEHERHEQHEQAAKTNGTTEPLSAATTSEATPSRRLSRLFVKTPRESARKKSEAGASESIAGATVATATTAAVVNPSSPPHTVSDKASTPLSPISPLSDSEASSPSSNKVKSWLKSRFSRPRTKSSASGTTAPGAGPAAAVASGAAEPPETSAEKSFVGGHALTSSEVGSTRGRAGSGSGPSNGSGTLNVPIVGGIAAAGIAGGAAAITTATDRPSKEGEASGTAAVASETAPSEVAAAGIPEEAKPVLPLVSTPRAEAPPPETSPWHEGGRSFSLGPLTPVIVGPSHVPGTAGALAPAAASSPGDSASYASSSYSGHGGVGGGTGAAGGEVASPGSVVSPGLVDPSILAAIRTANTSGSFVSVPPPSSLSGAGDASAGGDAGAAPFTPPKVIRDPAQKKSASPVRDSRFLEEL